MRKIVKLMAMATVAIGITACGSSTDNQSNNNNTYQEQALNSNETEFITVNHLSGTTEVKVNPERVVVFDLGILDTLDYLGVEVIGLPKNSLPTHLLKYDSDEFLNLGTLHEPNLELINEQDPDLIIISGRARPAYDELSQIAPTIDLGLDNSDIMGSFIRNNIYIGQIFGLEEEVQQALADIEQSIEDIRVQAETLDRTGLILLANEGRLSAFGSESRFGIIHNVMGITPVDSNLEINTHGQLISNEYIVENNPDILFIVDRGAVVSSGEAANRDDIENELIQLTNAYINGDIYYLTPEIWYTAVGGIQGMQMQIAEMQEIISQISNN